MKKVVILITGMALWAFLIWYMKLCGISESASLFLVGVCGISIVTYIVMAFSPNSKKGNSENQS